MVRGVERYCFEQGYNLMLGNTEGQAETALSYLKMMLRKRVDGLLIMCSEGSRRCSTSSTGSRACRSW